MLKLFIEPFAIKEKLNFVDRCNYEPHCTSGTAQRAVLATPEPLFASCQAAFAIYYVSTSDVYITVAYRTMIDQCDTLGLMGRTLTRVHSRALSAARIFPSSSLPVIAKRDNRVSTPKAGFRPGRST